MIAVVVRGDLGLPLGLLRLSSPDEAGHLPWLLSCLPMHTEKNALPFWQVESGLVRYSFLDGPYIDVIHFGNQGLE